MFVRSSIYCAHPTTFQPPMVCGYLLMHFLHLSRNTSLVVDNAPETLGHKRSTTNKGTIDVRLSHKTINRIRANTSTVEDASIVRDLLTIHIREDSTASGMDTLRNFRSRNLPSANSPNRFICE